MTLSIVKHASTVVWCLTDSRPGHVNQLRGLVAALQRRRDVDDHWINVGSRWRTLWGWASGRCDLGHTLPAPHLILAAGHATHTAALAARRACGGRVVLLMRPSLPTQLFDLCLIPEHDLSYLAVTGENVILTSGVLNNVRAEPIGNSTQGLLLIGGPSKHHDWDDATMCDQIADILRFHTEINWTLTNSRRTPNSFLPRLKNLIHDHKNLTIVPVEQTKPGWVVDRLATAKTVFVSEDSVSMVYEALSTSAEVGLLHVPRRHTSRVIRGVDRLVEARNMTAFERWRHDRFQQQQRTVLQEADRCAEIVCTRLLDAA